MWPESEPLRVVIADDDERYAELIAMLLQSRPELEVIGIAKDGEEAVQLACWQDADVVLMDIDMPRIDGIVATRLVREAKPRMCVLMLSGADPGRFEEAREAGAIGYVNKLDAPADQYPPCSRSARPLSCAPTSPSPPSARVLRPTRARHAQGLRRGRAAPGRRREQREDAARGSPSSDTARTPRRTRVLPAAAPRSADRQQTSPQSITPDRRLSSTKT